MKETETREFKKSTSELKEAIISLVAILNKHGKGQLYFGIDNSGNCVGTNCTENTLREISQTIANSIEPKIYPKLEMISRKDKKIIKIAFVGDNKPYYAFGRAYMRVADENRQLSSRELERMIIHKSRSNWEEELSEKNINDIKVKLLKEYVQKANAVKNWLFRSVLPFRRYPPRYPLRYPPSFNQIRAKDYLRN